MVNYCCVFGCGRNSRTDSHLTFHTFPKERDRQHQWLQAAKRDDLYTDDITKLTKRRVCSRHFEAANIKNRLLAPQAVPTLCLPGSWSDDDEPTRDRKAHKDIACDSCRKPIKGFRYKCITCPNYDLCQPCETREVHSEHCMLRMPLPLKYVEAQNMTKKLSNTTNIEQTYKEDSNSSDDEPITKYMQKKDDGSDLPEDVKKKIREEVVRALYCKIENESDIKPKDKKHRIFVVNTDRNCPEENLEDVTYSKRSRNETAVEERESSVLEVEFADVDDINDGRRTQDESSTQAPVPPIRDRLSELIKKSFE